MDSSFHFNVEILTSLYFEGCLVFLEWICHFWLNWLPLNDFWIVFPFRVQLHVLMLKTRIIYSCCTPKYPKAWWLKNNTYYLTVSLGQESGHSLDRFSSSGSPTRLQPRCNLGLWSFEGWNVEAPSEKLLLSLLSGCWQNSVPGGLWAWGPSFFLTVDWKTLSVHCHMEFQKKSSQHGFIKVS